LVIRRPSSSGIGNFLHLKFLTLNQIRITKVPEEIAKLRYLETLNINCIARQNALVPATISQDGRLVHFVADRCTIPDEIEGTEAVEVLVPIYVEHRSTNFIRRLGHLTNLRKLDLRVVSYEAERELACSIRKLVKANLRSLHICLGRGPNNLIEELNLPAECSIEELSVHGCSISKVPRWMGSLVNLQKLHINLSIACQEDLEILGGLPDLRYISVTYDSSSGDQLKAAMEILIADHPNHPMLVCRERDIWFDGY